MLFTKRYEHKVLPRLQILSVTFQKNYIASMSLDLQDVRYVEAMHMSGLHGVPADHDN